jgi:hypothetical protein
VVTLKVLHKQELGALMLEADGEVQEPLQPDSVSRCTAFSLLLGFIVSISCFLPLSSISLFSLLFPLFPPPGPLVFPLLPLFPRTPYVLHRYYHQLTV